MSAEPGRLVEYTPHGGTIRISGKTIPKGAAACAHHFLEQGVENIDFWSIGANAGQQAAKAMSIFAYQFHQKYLGLGFVVSYIPLRFLTKTSVPGSEVFVEKDCMVWRLVIGNSVPMTEINTKLRREECAPIK